MIIYIFDFLVLLLMGNLIKSLKTLVFLFLNDYYIYLSNRGEDMDLVLELIASMLSSVNNIYFWVVLLLIVLFISEIKINEDNLKEKFILSYLLLILLRFLGLLSIKFILFFIIPFYFIFIELIFNKKKNKVIISNPFFYIIDYLYIMIFKFHILGFLLSLFVISEYYYSNVIFVFPDCEITYYILGILSLVIYLYTINKISFNKFNTLSFNEIVDKMENILSFKDYKHDYRLDDFIQILSWYEDRSFLARKNNYNLINFSFIKYKFNKVFNRRVNKIYNIKIIGIILKYIVTILIIIFKIFRNIIYKIRNICVVIYKIIRKKRKLYSIRSIIRGYSTIEMQLLRTLALKDGYENTIQRKLFEIIYTDIFFKSLKNTFRYYYYGNLKEYKFYLLELYIRVAPTFINNKRYNNINLLFKDRNNLFELTNEEFFLFTLGLSNKEIDFDKIDSYYCPITLDRMRYVKALEEVLGKSYCKYPDENGIEVKMMLYDLNAKKRFPIIAYFSPSKSFADISNFIKENYCISNYGVRIENLIEILFKGTISDEALRCIYLPIEELSLYDNLLKVSIVDVLLYKLNDFTINIVYNISGGIGGTVDIKNGIRYYFNNNEKSTHAHLPHINCSYSGEHIRINLLNCKVLNKKKFKSPVKTREAIKHVRDNQDKYLDIWENVVDKDNVLNKKIVKEFLIK